MSSHSIGSNLIHTHANPNTNNIVPLFIKGSYHSKLQTNDDNRGCFLEIVREFPSKQINMSESVPNVIRGIHASSYGKLVTCISGSLTDYVVDLRPESATYLTWAAVKLEPYQQIYIPPNCGHAFISGSNGCKIVYAQEGVFSEYTNTYYAWNDPIINLPWPSSGIDCIISEKDRSSIPYKQTMYLTSRPKVLVIGGSGQLGQSLLNVFNKDSPESICIGTYYTHKYDNCSLYLNFEDTTYAEIEILLNSIQPHVVFICSALASADVCETQKERAYQINAHVPGWIAKAGNKINAKIVYFSSDYVFDGKHGPYSEDDTPNPINVYGQTKFEGETQLLNNSNPDNILIIRTTGIYGPDLSANNFVYQVARRKRSQYANDQIGNPIDSRDLSMITYHLSILSNVHGIVNVSGPTFYDRYSFACAILKTLDPEHNSVESHIESKATDNLAQIAKRPLLAGLKIDKLKTLLPQFEFRSLSDSFKDWNPLLQQSLMSTSKKIWYAPHKFEAYGNDEIDAVCACLKDGWLAPNTLTTQFEQQVSSFFGKQFGIMVNSGSSANMIALAILDLTGKEVITPACTFATCIAPMVQLGIKPKFIDVELGTYVPSVQAILDAINENTACIFIPNLIGSKINWKELRERLPRPDIILIEDSCDTMTHTPESDISVVSFYASHIITAGGCGGMVMLNDKSLLKKALMYRDWGRIGDNRECIHDRFNFKVDDIPYDFKFLYGVLGYNFKCCEMNAAFGLEQMKKLKQFLKIRSANVERYIQNLSNKTQYILPLFSDKHDWLAFPLMLPEGQTNKRIDLIHFLEDNNVQVRVCFAGNITRHPAFRDYLECFPNSDLIMAGAFLIGAHHGMTLDDVDRVSNLLIDFDRSFLSCV